MNNSSPTFPKYTEVVRELRHKYKKTQRDMIKSTGLSQAFFITSEIGCRELTPEFRDAVLGYFNFINETERVQLEESFK